MLKPKNILFEAIVGSQAYNLATKTSDLDVKGVYLQSNEDILSNRYVPQVNVDKDTTYYELRRFLELVSTGNPNVLELLYIPERCVLKTSPEWKELLKHREKFLTKKCYGTYQGYATSQMKKATGLNKKFNYEKGRTERKDILDFCKLIDRQNGKTYTIKKWLKNNGYTQDQIGLASIDGFKGCYRLYTDDLKWAKDNARGLEFEDRHYKGIGDESTNEPRKSVIEKYMINDWKGILQWNKEAYSIHCREYREYKHWLKERNESRVATNKKHGQDYDSKSLLHLVRLIMTGQEIPTERKINVDRTKDREYLLSIKRGDVDLKALIEEWGNKAEEMKGLYENSDLPEEVDKDFTKNLELKIRNYEDTENTLTLGSLDKG